MSPKKQSSKPGPSGLKKQVSTVPDSDHIVFGKDKDSKKAGKDEQPPPPRIDVKKVIGGASWTGKLPVNLLSEHCQRQKWNKPDYSMRQVPSGTDGEKLYRSSVTLSTTNPKTRETTTLPPFHLPNEIVSLSNQPTALEARHFAAAYALFRISSMKSIHMTLPPHYRDLWKGTFAQLKEEDIKEGRGWKYDADPFAAEAKRHEIQATIQKRKEDKEKAEAKALTLGLSLPGGMAPRSKAWDSAPNVDLGQKLRMEIEQIVSEGSNWNRYRVELSAAERDQVIAAMLKLGFRKSHIEEALQYCRDGEEVLEWLLIHVPEDGLPLWSFPPGYSAGITFASGDLAKEAKLKRLASAGYSTDACAQALQDHNGDERAAAQVLQDQLLASEIPARGGEDEQDKDDSVWDEEMVTLKAILDNRFSKPSTVDCIVSSSENSAQHFDVKFTRPSKGYPRNDLPLICLEATLPAHVRLAATKKALMYAQQNCMGDMMLYTLVEWLESSLPDIIENPGPLRALHVSSGQMAGGDISSNYNGHAVMSDRRKKQQLPRSDDSDTNIKEEWISRQKTPAFQRMLATRQKLPAWNKQDEIVKTVLSHQVVIISGETGSGKSTQAVQFILDDLIQHLHGGSANIVCTQPRRISALGLSDRVSQERCSKEGDDVGYIIRGEAKVTRKTKITFMTTGVLLRRLQSRKGMGEALQGISHVFVDEVHERNLDTDFLLALIRDALKQKPDLRLVLMSATLDADVFTTYFSGNGKVGRVNIEGRIFPIDDYYLDDVVKLVHFGKTDTLDELDEDVPADGSMGKTIRDLGAGINYDLIADLVRHIDADLGQEQGAILIFLPGTGEIERSLRNLSHMPNMHALPLHASLLPSEQRRVFPPAPSGKRKVIATTNVAETSITIEDVVAVIDTGRVKETRYDASSNVVRLLEVWASQAACKQRRGRSGRVRAGKCYKLFTRNIESNMPARPEPEIRRVPLEQLCLSVKATGTDKDIGDFLANTLTPPDTGAVQNAITTLHRMSALDSGHLTALGTYLAIIPADLRCAKLLVYACIFGCLESCLTIAAILTSRSPFVSPREKREEAKEARRSFPSTHGDLLLDLAACDEYIKISQQRRGWREVQRWCGDNFLSIQTLRDITSTRTQLLDSLKDTGLVPLSYSTYHHSPIDKLNLHNSNSLLLRSLIAAALQPQLARIQFPDKKYIASMSGAKELDPEARTIKYFTQVSQDSTERVFVHPASCFFDAQSYSQNAGYLSYFNKMATSKTFIRELTPCNAFSVLLFGGQVEVDREGRGLLVDGWLRMRGWARIGVLVSRLRVLLDESLRRQFERQGDAVEDRKTERLLDVVRRLVELNGQDQ